jgi:hypothetical protein
MVDIAHTGLGIDKRGVTYHSVDFATRSFIPAEFLSADRINDQQSCALGWIAPVHWLGLGENSGDQRRAVHIDDLTLTEAAHLTAALEHNIVQG